MSYILWATALFIGYLVGLGANAKIKSLRVPNQGHLWGVCFMQERPLLPTLGHYRRTKQWQVSQIPQITWAAIVFPVTFLLFVFEVFSFGKVSLERPHLNVRCECYFQSWTHTEHFRRSCCGMVLPRNEMNYLNKRMSYVKFSAKTLLSQPSGLEI